MSDTGNWCVGALIGVLGLVGLFLASRAVDDALYIFGLALFGFAILFIFGTIRRAFDEAEAAEAEGRP